MQAAALSIASLVDNIDIASIKLPNIDSSVNFQALLSVGIAQNPASTNTAESHIQKHQDQPDSAALPQAVAIDVPVPIQAAPPTPPSPEHRDTSVQSQKQDQNFSSPPQNTPPSTDSKQTTPATNTPSKDAEPTSLPAKNARTALKDQLGNIDQILQSIIQALSGSATTGQNPAPQPAATTADVANTSAASLQPQLPVQILPTTALSANTTAAAIPVLKDIQAILQQLQQNLPSAGASAVTAQVTTANAPDSVDALAQKMLQDVAQLSQLLSPQTSVSTATLSASVSNVPLANVQVTPQANGGTIPIPTSLSSDTAPSPEDLTLILKTGIADVKAQLQKLKTNNDAQFAQTKLDLQAQFSSLKTSFASTQDTGNANNNAQPVASAPAVSNAVIASAPQIAVTPAPVNADTSFIPPTTVIAVAQSDTNNSGDSGSGNSSQNQTAAQPVLAASTDKATAAPADSAATFSRMLGKVSSGSILEQVSFQIKTTASDSSSKIHIQLDPAELGKLEIKLSVGANGKTDVTVTADSRSTLDLLQRDSGGLARALTDAGLSTDGGSLNFNLRGGDQQQGQGGNNQAALTYKKTQPEEEDGTAIASTVISRNYVVNLSEGLDIKI